jgi:hypothetical protein
VSGRPDSKISRNVLAARLSGIVDAVASSIEKSRTANSPA